MTISVTPNDLVIVKGKTAQFIAMATGISTNESNFMYQWKKKDGGSLPGKVSGAILKIPNVAESDEGQYYCNVTNEWGRTVRSNDVSLSIFGMLIVVVTNLVASTYYSINKPLSNH